MFAVVLSRVRVRRGAALSGPRYDTNVALVYDRRKGRRDDLVTPPRRGNASYMPRAS